MEAQGESQPTQQQGYEAPGNAASRQPAEERAANAQTHDNSEVVDRRIPTKQSSSIEDATPSSLGRGIRGAGPGEEAKGETHESVGRNQELQGEQMSAPGEGAVADAVNCKPGASGEQEDLADNLDKKKREQAPAREEIKEQRRENIDVGGILGQRGGPANPVDKDNYPNSGS